MIVDLISCGIALFVVFGLTSIYDNNKAHKRIDNMYRKMNNRHDTDKWKR